MVGKPGEERVDVMDEKVTEESDMDNEDNDN